MTLSFEIKRSHLVMFCLVDLNEKLSLAAALQNSNRNRFDGEPMLLPPLPDALPEVPGIVLQSKNGSASLTVSAARVDVAVNHPGGAFRTVRDLLGKEEAFFKRVAETLSSSDQVKNTFSRLGMILTISAQLDDSRLAQVRKRFLNPQLETGCHRIELGFLDRQEWGDFQVNRWLRVATSVQDNRSGSLEVTLDFNTIPQMEYNVDSVGVGQFLEMLKSKADSEMKVFND